MIIKMRVSLYLFKPHMKCLLIRKKGEKTPYSMFLITFSVKLASYYQVLKVYPYTIADTCFVTLL